jgi:2-aminoadipate transaminase
MLESLQESFKGFEGSVHWTQPRGGLYVWLSVPEGVDTGPAGPLFARCLEQGVLYVPGAYAYADEPGAAPKNHARLCFGVPSEADLAEGTRRLSLALAECLDPVA